MYLPEYHDAPNVLELMPDTSFFTYAQIFDDVLLVSNRVTAAYVLKTSEGLILIDAIYPKKEMFDAIVGAIREIGWDPTKIRKFLITHGHFDHCGCGRWIVEAFHPEVCLSKVDTEFWRDCPFFPDRPETWKDFDVDRYIADGDTVTLGDTTVQVLETPGHTPGGLSFIFPVHDQGETYMAAMWGGTNPPNDISGVVTYMKSLDHFVAETQKAHCDVMLCNHPRLSGFERIEAAKARYAHMSNVFIIGEKAFSRFCGFFRRLCYDRLLEIEQRNK